VVSPLSLRATDPSSSVRVWADESLERDSGVVVAFSERGGGVSGVPFDGLNLAAHVGDDPAAVDENRSRLLGALGLEACRDRLTMAEQVHGERIALVDAKSAGSGAFAVGTMPPLAGTDAVMTVELGVPLLLCFADCVPVILVAPGPAVAVVHAGWRGALGSLAGRTASELASVAACEVSELAAYVGAHVRACHYQVGP
jgi:copper oxidase (laccase) domain-containing protein